MTNSIVNAHKILNCECCNVTSYSNEFENFNSRKKLEDFQGFENVSPTQENITILMETLKFFGKDANIV